MVCVIVIIALITTMFPKEGRVSEKKEISDSEIARSMTYPQVVDGEESTASEYVTFDAFFLRDLDGDGVAEKIRGTCREIGAQDTLYFELKVNGSGRFENGVITINGENFYLETKIPKDDRVLNNAIGSNIKKIELNTIENGSQVFLTGVVKSGDYLYSSRKAEAIGNDISNYSKINSVTLTGKHVADDGTVTELQGENAKTVNFNVDWHGRVHAQITSKNKTYDTLDDTIDEENQEVKLTFEVRTQETLNQLVLSKSYIEGTIPDLNGYAPKSVEITGTNVHSEYDSETKKFIASREAVVGENGKITSSVPRENVYTLKVTYPLEAFTSMGPDVAELDIRIPVEAYYEGFNNENDEFTNPYKSNVDKDIVIALFKRYGDGDYGFSLAIGKYVTSPTSRYIVSKKKPLNIYNGVSDSEFDDTYVVMWRAYSGKDNDFQKMTMRERKAEEGTIVDKFIKSNSASESMEDVTSNIGVYMSNPANFVGEDGFVKIYDDVSNELLVTFTKDNWNRYSSANPYLYEVPVKHIRVETSATIRDANLYVYNVKELDDDYITTNYEKVEFDELRHIETRLVGCFGETNPITVQERAVYEAPVSVAKVSIDTSVISTQETKENVKIQITTEANAANNEEKWLNGSFLLKLPPEILDIEAIAEISNGRVSITSYEIYEENGSKFIKILTENDNPETYTITLNATITPDPRSLSVSRSVIELYATNEECGNYYYTASDIYDVNSNLNTSEIVNRTTTNVSLIAPDSLLTNQVARNYDDKGSSVIGPQIAYVDKDRREATIDVSIRNNYSSSVSEIQILGKIPTEGNTYALSGRELGSNYSTTMTSDGIQIPAELQSYAKVYYSTVENPTRDVNNLANGWKSEGINWSEVKSYLIVLDGYTMPREKEHTFSYKINIPEGLDYNQIAYSHHGVYFSLNTDQGLYRTSIEPNKLGLMITKQFDIEITKYQKGIDKKIPGVIYSIREEGATTGKSGATYATGEINISGLFVERTYIIKEVRAPQQYEVSSEEIKLTTRVNEAGKLEANVDGTLREGTSVVVEEIDGKFVVKMALDDEVRANLKLLKVEKNSASVPVESVRYKLTGKGFSRGRTLVTNAKGEVSLSGLYINEEYTLEEIKAEGYYLANPIKFKIVNNSGNYELVKLDGEISEVVSNKVDDIPVLQIKLEDEKIPRYNLKINKVVKGTETPLEGVKFRLYKDDKEIGSYVTDVNGNIAIPNLYQYEAEKDVDQTYTLKETFAPEGYSAIKDITFHVSKNAEGLLVMDVKEGKIERQTTDGETITITIGNSKSFKLIKTDGETGEVLPNTKFAIYNVDDGLDQLALDSKNNILGTKEIINGREYYTLTTNEKGEIEADLREGLYKAVEVKASDDKYDITGNTYYFGIGASREAIEGIVLTFASSVGENWCSGEGMEEIESAIVAATSDGGYIVAETLNGIMSSLTHGEEKTPDDIKNNRVLIKYSPEDKVEWTTSVYGNIGSVIETTDGKYLVGGSNRIIKYNKKGEVEDTLLLGNSGSITSVAETIDGDYAVVGKFYGTTNIGDYTFDCGTYGSNIIIRCTTEGKVELATVCGDRSSINSLSSVVGTTDGGYIVGGRFSGTIELGEYTATGTTWGDAIVIKYSADNEVEWVSTFGGDGTDSINSVVETIDGGYIAVGKFEKTIQVGEYTLTATNVDDGLIIKYSTNGDVEWAKKIGSVFDDEITSVALMPDGGYIVGGTFENVEKIEEYTLNGRGHEDGLIIKYSVNDEVEWVATYGGSGSDYINSVAATTDGGYVAGGRFSGTMHIQGYTLTSSNLYDSFIVKCSKKELENPVIVEATSFGGTGTDRINSVVATSDGGYIAGGYFNGTIQIGDKKYTSAGGYDGIIIKYSRIGTIEWVVTYGGSNDDAIRSIAETQDGGYIAGGYFYGTIRVGNKTYISNGNGDGIIIKYDSVGKIEWASIYGGSNYDYINSVVQTVDGGYIAGGDFHGTIKVGDKTYTSNGNDDGIIIKYDSVGEIEWASTYGGSSDDYINSVVQTVDGGYIAGGWFYGTIQVGDNAYTSKENTDGIVIKYSSDGEIEWASTYGESKEDKIKSVVATTDGGCIVGGYSNIERWRPNDKGGASQYFSSVVNIIKYSRDGEIERKSAFIGESSVNINSMAMTLDGGYIVGGEFYGTIQVGDMSYTSKGSTDGIIIKYSSDGEIECISTYGGSDYDYINSVAETADGKIIAGGYFNGTTQIGEKTYTSNGGSDAILFSMVANAGVPETEILQVENAIRKLKITTDVKEIDGKKGGSISGEDMNPYETVKYGGASTKEIVMIPEENYEIIGITVNGEEWPFEANADGTYTMPQFENMTEDKHIVVTYSQKDNKIVINKVDSKTNNPIAGVKFKLDQIEERTKPEGVIGELTGNSAEYTEAEPTNEVTGVMGELTDSGTSGYYFKKNEDGKYVPTNKGQPSVTANSYIEIDLTEKTGIYAVKVNAYVSSESNYDYGYASITENNTVPEYNSITGQFIYISGTTSNVTTSKDYTSMALEGGKKYYLHLGYRKDGGGNQGDDQFVINSVKVYEATETIKKYNFIEDGKYKSSNQGKGNTVSNSYIPIDLTGYSGKYNLIVNAEISSQSGYDYGYATVTTNETRPSYYSTTGRFVYISGTQSAKDYTTVLDGGDIYYLHLGYRKDARTDTGDDTFTVNNIRVELNDSELYHIRVETNSEGQAITQIPFGKYSLTEMTTPEGYFSMDKSAVINFKADDKSILENENKIGTISVDNGEFIVKNIPKEKVIVHHYKIDRNGNKTEEKVTEDDLLVQGLDETGNPEENYSSEPHSDLTKYKIDESNYPENASGKFTDYDEVTYYYIERQIPIIVHHYIEGTTTPVPLAKDVNFEDFIATGEIYEGYTYEDNSYKASGYEEEDYATAVIPDNKLSDEYELCRILENSKGKYGDANGEEIIVNYEYKRVRRELNLVKYAGDGETRLEGAKFDIRKKREVPKPLPKVDDIVDNGTIGFVKQDDKFVSNNKQHNTGSYSYIKVDLTGVEDTIVKVNAEVSSERNYDIGYVTITETPDVPSYNKNRDYFIKISGTVEADDYETELKGGKVYYIHFAYVKDGSGANGTDTFTINSIKIGTDENYTYTTDVDGKIRVTLDSGEYEVTEIEAPKGYQLPENPTTIVTIVKERAQENIEVINERAQGTLIVHHYIEGTNIPVRLSDGTIVESEVSKKYMGEFYETNPKHDLQAYEFVSSEGETRGQYTDGIIEVTYYYALPSYTLNINKKNKKNEVIPRTEFKVKNVDTNQEFTAITDENGIATIEGLYQFIEETGFVNEYILQETVPTEGYLKNDTEVRFRAVKREDGKLNITILEGENVISNSSSDETSVTFEIVNESTFKLIKKGDNGVLLPGAKFKITDEYGYPAWDGNNTAIGEFVEEKNNELTFAPGDIPAQTEWTQIADGTWQSGGAGIDNATSAISSDEFTITEAGTLTFEWAASTEDTDYDYLTYVVTNLDTKETIGGQNNVRIGGNSDISSYDELSFVPVTIDLNSGRYKIEFIYIKDEDYNDGLDKGFVRNVKINDASLNFTPVEYVNPMLWQQREDGTWESGAKGISGSVSAMYSEAFVINESGKVSFEWAQSVAGDGDHLEYIIINLETYSTVKSGSLQGVNSGDTYDELTFNLVENDLSAGTYSISFGYLKDGSGNGGLDAGFVRNVKVDGNEINNFSADRPSVPTESDTTGWTQREDGTWESGGSGIDDAISVMTSDEFTLTENGTLTFEWAASTEDVSYDYLTYVITNLDTKETIGGADEVRIGDNPDISSYDELSFVPVIIDLNSGRYKVEFIYMKDSSVNDGLDKGFVRNAKINDTSLNFTSMEYVELIKWTEREDGTWESGGKGVANLESILSSNVFTISEGRMLSFEWAASTETINNDYLYCRIINLDSGSSRPLSRIGGNSEVTTYEELEFQPYLTYLPAGRYAVQFIYIKNSSGDGGLDAGFVRNVKLGYFAAETDANGEIIAGLPEGEYKVEEVEAPEGYQLPENVEDRVHSVVIDGTKQEVIEITNELKKFKVTTEIDENSEGERAGGTVTGEATVEPNINFVEEVKYGYKSAREIVVTPDKGYEVSSIKINGVDYEFVKDKSGVVTIPVFEDVKEDYHIKVIFNVKENTIVGSKEANIEKGLDYVTEGDKIRYTIKAKNEGIRDASAIIKDSVPAGTTFVDGSITINGTKNEVMTEADLTNGIEVTVVAEGEATVSFEVIVTADAIEAGKFEGNVSNIAVVNEENTETVVTPVKKPNVVVSKSANPATNTKVKVNDEIRYSIELNNSTGTAPTKVRVKDGAPKGTRFIEGSMTLESSLGSDRNVDLSSKTEAELKNTGIDVELEAGEIKTLSFTVKVVDLNDKSDNDLADGYKIVNTAYVNKNPEDLTSKDEPTNEVVHTYVEPIITAKKTYDTEKGHTYVEEDETITYTITVTNDGGLGKDVVIKDTIQAGMTFKAGSIKVNGKTIAYGLADLETNGITVNVPAKVGDTKGTATVSFDVTVDKLTGEYSKELKNTATVDDVPTEEVTVVVNKANIVGEKTVDVGNGQEVRRGDVLTYNIKVSNNGTLAGKATIVDTIPENTTYFANSVEVVDKAGAKTTYTDEELAVGKDGLKLTTAVGDTMIKGISAEEVEVEPGEYIILRFKVKVNSDAENGDKIENTAIVNGNPTTPVENTVIRPIIAVEKEIAEVAHMNGDKEIDGLKDRKDYVFRGDTITYNIKATNTGDAEGKIVIKDTISDKVNLVENSIKVDGTVQTGKTATHLSDGIEITVPAKTGETADSAGETILSFTVKVKGDASIIDETGVDGDVINKATWAEKKDPESPETSEEKETNEVSLPIVVFKKVAKVARTTEEEIAEESVTAKDEITYTILVENTGSSATGKFVVTDDIPEGTTILDSNGGIISDKTISWTIDNLLAKEEGKEDNKVEISFTVTVKYAEVMPEKIVNIAYVNDKPTNETETPYVKPTPKMETEIVKTGDDITMAGNKVYYKMTYTGKINDFAGKACVTIVDELPYRIDEDKSELNGGDYEEDLVNKKYTITWNLPVEEINTYVSTEDYIAGNEYVINAEKEMWLYYTDNLGSEFTNKAIATTQLKEPDLDNPGSDKDVGTPDIAEGTHTVAVKTAYKLPETGRNGTTIFAIIGLMIVGVAVTMGYKAKRKDI